MLLEFKCLFGSGDGAGCSLVEPAPLGRYTHSPQFKIESRHATPGPLGKENSSLLLLFALFVVFLARSAGSGWTLTMTHNVLTIAMVEGSAVLTN